MRTTVNFFLLLLCSLVFFACNKSNDKLTSNSTGYNSNIEKGFSSLQKQKLDSAFFYFNQAHQHAVSNDEKVYALLQMAFIQTQIADFSAAEETLTQAYKTNTSPAYDMHIYNALGIAYLEQNNYQEAINYYDKILNDTISEINKCIILNNKAVVYLEQSEYQKAINIETKIWQNDSLKKDKKQWAKILDNLGYAYYKTNNNKALELLLKAKSIRDSINDDYEKIASYIHLSQYYQNTNQELAASYAQSAFQFASKINNPDDKMEALQYWIINAQPNEAKSLALKQMKLSDSINKVRQSAKNQFAKIRFDASKAEQEKLKSEKQKQTIFWILIAVAVIAFITILLIRYRNKQKLKTSIYDTETRISKKIHDELANDVFQALTFAETQDLSNPQKKETFLNNLDDIYLRTRNIANANSQVNTNANYQENLFNMISGFNSPQTNVIINSDDTIDWNKIKRETKITLYRVLQELMVNMKKHSNCSVVVLSFINHPKQIQIKYADNGKGINPETFDKKGLQNVENRIFTLNGTIIFESETQKGFKVNIEIPK
ncbi:tetratricopeptide repeat-containing sensor histidine kinase [Flavobacterium capsici]|uniref:Tetratricopeptide repeat protein n=1 Tax=Flavobacterium capsici TaxID=3075618 RepID=A0AA96F3A0_9FLAO|nr:MULTISPECIES: tetratricopeptide repeat protein [unclassified Flavobacterium]WNM19136.1 tetratricopeptide repeat protein [Flavobacterium sp. PMR2A8]WNM20525.1 tetratricopeptide repeat protein [Flavobacterium sp. PMTSA4]